MIPVDGQVLRKEDGESWCCCGLNLKEVQLERKQMCTFRDPSKIDSRIMAGTTETVDVQWSKKEKIENESADSEVECTESLQNRTDSV